MAVDAETRAVEPTKSRRKIVEGVVVSDRMQRTITVVVKRLELHDRYKKYVHRKTKLRAHDEREEAKVGDRVRISETRPLSRTKRWRLVEIVRKAQ